MDLHSSASGSFSVDYTGCNVTNRTYSVAVTFDGDNINPITKRLSTVVDVPVNGGIIAAGGAG